jgi:hypothetical protein
MWSFAAPLARCHLAQSCMLEHKSITVQSMLVKGLRNRKCRCRAPAICAQRPNSVADTFGTTATAGVGWRNSAWISGAPGGRPRERIGGSSSGSSMPDLGGRTIWRHADLSPRAL